MSSLQINKTGIQVQMTTNNKKLISLADMLEELREIATEMLSKWVRLAQEETLSEWIGGPWQPLPAAQRKLGCPRCGSVDVVRKCWRSRGVNVACFGATQLPLRQVRCKDCGRTWMPSGGAAEASKRFSRA